jgi:hypothetical protein
MEEFKEVYTKRITQRTEDIDSLSFKLSDPKVEEDLKEYIGAELNRAEEIEKLESQLEPEAGFPLNVKELRQRVRELKQMANLQALDRGEETTYTLDKLGLGYKQDPTISSRSFPVPEVSLTAFDMVVPESSGFFEDRFVIGRASDPDVKELGAEWDGDGDISVTDYLTSTTRELIKVYVDRILEAEERLRELKGEEEPTEQDEIQLQDQQQQPQRELQQEQEGQQQEGQQAQKAGGSASSVEAKAAKVPAGVAEEGMEEGEGEYEGFEEGEVEEEDPFWRPLHGIYRYDSFSVETVLRYLQRHPEDRQLFSQWDPIEHAQLEYDMKNVTKDMLDRTGEDYKIGPAPRPVYRDWEAQMEDYLEATMSDEQKDKEQRELLDRDFEEKDDAAAAARNRNPPSFETPSQRFNAQEEGFVNYTVQQNEKALRAAGFGDLLDSIENKYAYLPSRMKRNLDYKRAKSELQKKQQQLLETLRKIGKENGVDVEDTLLHFERRMQSVLTEDDRPTYDERLTQLTGYQGGTGYKSPSHWDKLINNITEDLLQESKRQSSNKQSQ